MFKGAIKNTSKKSLYNIEYTVEKEYKNDRKENGYTDSGVFNDNKTNDTINNTINENGISNSKKQVHELIGLMDKITYEDIDKKIEFNDYMYD